MRTIRTIFFTLLFGAATAAWACTPDLPAAKGRKVQTIDSTKYVLAYRTQPEAVVIGQHFVMELALCAKAGAAAPESVRVDALMPDHRHGMNYKTTVTGAAGKYRAEGLMFHMPGRWEYIFEVRAAGTTERITASVVLQ
jgi:hypothetical protein